MKKLLFFLIIGAWAQINPDCSDEDKELAEKCDKNCQDEFKSCHEACDSTNCEHSCLREFVDCTDSCPCFIKCPDGCENCPNDICKSCMELETNRISYEQCISEASSIFDSCVKNCSIEKSCHDDCSWKYSVSTDKCPCMERCAEGCPCTDGYACEKEITIMCQGDPSFSYAITPSGTLAGDRYFQSEISKYEPHLFIFFNSGHSLLNGQMFFFGGGWDARAIGKLNECSIERISSRLVNDFYAEGDSLVEMPFSNEIILCSDGYRVMNCEVFNGESTSQISSTIFYHNGACMAAYDDKATIIAGVSGPQTEILFDGDWSEVAPFPKKIEQHSCVSVRNGIILAGGLLGEEVNVGYIYNRNVYFGREGIWSIVGILHSDYKLASMIYNDANIIIANGYMSELNAVESMKWDGNSILSTAIINYHAGPCPKPTLFVSLPSQCSDPCDDFCYTVDAGDIGFL
ncbi:Oidioi.mRNA.OKI2018_I69.chr1.g1871.t1.cds [Oikopleura dioica]|uniref:Oidioi.mRNA.OKI2018_I69.chr1.g1871.t1.cds n=1 Tax=Oikopleura dioica TaxID=34765 RepID=A0ABN7ST48_OIKDI|nr:Oidioi.mRNA.OKI2018_I69.chr1.g1871.t1.cds [Oikopleura dioica]